ncbi:MAG: hypothetical protein ISR91_01470 [Candidatus Delongbacteria bacterium]|nr:hypothetical protein [Candidatus Delongbacteria bacterium]
MNYRNDDVILRTDELNETTAPTRIPKYQTFEAKLSILLTSEQLRYLEEMVGKIMRNRTDKKERITKNSIIRSLVEFMQTLDIDCNDIPDEKELAKRIFIARLHRIM